MSGTRAGRSRALLRTAALTISFALLLLVAAAGPSAAKPALGPRGWAPGNLPISLSSAVVTSLLWAAYLLGALAVALGLWQGSRGGDSKGDGSRGRGSSGGGSGEGGSSGGGSSDDRHRSGPWILARVAPALRQLRDRPWLLPLALGALALLTAPIGSADHTNYAAYGRISAQGGDPYLVPPIMWAGGTDPVTSAVEPPWTMTPSVYGPFSTALQTLSSLVGQDNLRQTVWVWQLLIVGAWLLVRFLLRLTSVDDRARTRIDLLWTANPIVFGIAVLGAHVDLIATALALGALLLAARRPWMAGVVLGAAVSSKITYGIVGLAILWSWRTLARGPLVRTMIALAVSSLGVFASLHLWAGPHVFDQLLKGGKGVSLATALRPVVNLLSALIPLDAARTVVSALSVAAFILLVWALSRLARWRPEASRTSLEQQMSDAPQTQPATAQQTQQAQSAMTAQPSQSAIPAQQAQSAMTTQLSQSAIHRQQTQSAMTATFVLATAYALAAPYALPWYSTLTWATLPLLLATTLDGILLAQLTVMAMAYVPGRVVAMSPDVESLTLGFRKIVGPLAAWLVWLAIAGVARRGWSRVRRGSRPPAS